LKATLRRNFGGAEGKRSEASYEGPGEKVCEGSDEKAAVDLLRADTEKETWQLS